ncbi:peroxidase 11 [Oryza sativa Japonica Group]|uniref:Peroxidase n=4 Tax=Oryza TaxID=4527 RepID=Q0DCY2_ORYSJ|nr:peroxidase 11 [Oryza sativa Japonica Group]XP_052157555.1 peroxidase 11 [Oryza glaberrima]EEC80385.1 hypothetical protein OsI_22509 [Oryza sativa Indica Group]KAB8102085.1 hypothetical protein EE612_033311 [Oryza sativa]EEE65514.1 hypothetical protein OsJ_20954 [Oryza sativa Japonica Group]KAF2926261.1 hypothetical protein DAI22_06g112700 [Oryza sativa Japonica Group]BAB19339.1 putative Peroxidase 49 precursor [Oryza sativa Japonica Group]|eukprot:NP_001057377.1 Os06g0274800 [Oryza sativa Japonica Group]
MATGVLCSREFALCLACVLLAVPLLVAQDPSSLSLEHYSKTCPNYEHVVRTEMECAVRADSRNAALMLRLHFHDCFVQGCDGSVLLDDTATLIGEKKAEQNVNSLKGFELVDKIKQKLEAECPGTVSCADLLAIAARDAVVLVGGPYWDVPVGRLDSKKASLDLANRDIPTAQQGLVTLIAKFWEKGLDATDMVALVGSHTIGFARCANFRDRIYGDYEMTTKYSPISQPYLSKLKDICPLDGGDDNISAMDSHTAAAFDNAYFGTLVNGEGLLNSDQEMWSSVLGYSTADTVSKYWADADAFFKQFSDSMVKMGNITNPAGGEVRKNCRFVNT